MEFQGLVVRKISTDVVNGKEVNGARTYETTFRSAPIKKAREAFEAGLCTADGNWDTQAV